MIQLAENIVSFMEGWYLSRWHKSIIATDGFYAIKFNSNRKMIRVRFTLHPRFRRGESAYYQAPSMTFDPDLQSPKQIAKLIEEKFLPKVHEKTTKEMSWRR